VAFARVCRDSEFAQFPQVIQPAKERVQPFADALCLGACEDNEPPKKWFQVSSLTYFRSASSKLIKRFEEDSEVTADIIHHIVRLVDKGDPLLVCQGHRRPLSIPTRARLRRG